MNPFVTKGYVSAKYFCDREKESQKLLHELENGNDVALIATRKIGKSGLVQHCFNTFDLEKDYNLFFIDFYATGTLREMVYMMSRSIVNALAPKGTFWLQRFSAAVRSLSLVMTTDLAGVPKLNLQLGELREPYVTLEEIFDYLEHSEKPNIVAIDEFQQIAKYPEKNVEALLRTYVQNCHNTKFIFAGSQRHLMGDIFTSAAHPFYQSTSVMHLGPIDKEKYRAFACGLFAEAGKNLNPSVIYELYNRFEGITWYMQKTLNALYALPNETQDYGLAEMEEAISNIIESNDFTFAEKMIQLPEKQKELLLAINQEGKAQKITSVNFVKRHKIYSTSTVQSACNGLLDKEFITEENGVYSVYDKFFDIWLRENY
ncbi:MAG: ATP-binding protein [Bacteroidales bacterium]|nr:ATP-binding protein [Bacteroidales bacterium]